MSWHSRLAPSTITTLARCGVHDATIAAWGHAGDATWLAAGRGPFTAGVRRRVCAGRYAATTVAGAPDDSRRLDPVDPLLAAAGDARTTTGVRLDAGTVTLFRARRRRGRWRGRAWTWHLPQPGVRAHGVTA